MAVLGGVNFPMLLLSDDLNALADVEQAAAQLLEQGKEAVVRASLVETPQSDDF